MSFKFSKAGKKDTELCKLSIFTNTVRKNAYSGYGIAHDHDTWSSLSRLYLAFLNTGTALLQ